MKYGSVHEIVIDVLEKQIEADMKKGSSKQEIFEKIEKIDSTMYSELFDKATIDLLDYFKSSMYEFIHEKQSLTDEFLAKQRQKWGKGFIAYESMYWLSVEAAEAYDQYLGELSKEEDLTNSQFQYLALRELHGRACQIFLEIFCLMQNGFADGAFARWRSMYELSVMSCFIGESGESVAKAFYEAAQTEDRYDWAKTAKCFYSSKYQDSNYHITFSDIAKQTHFIKNRVWKRQYDMGNKLVHASPQGTFKRLGIKGDTHAVIVGRTDYGISSPAEHAAISLAMITADFLGLHFYEDGIIAIKYITEWIDVIRDHFEQAEKDCFSDDNFMPIMY